jgi:membrane fusion protein, multidrug efflux system
LTETDAASGATPDSSTGATWEIGLEEQAPRAVEALEVTRGTLIPFIESSGNISGINEAYVVSETQGIIRDVRFEIGDTVEIGQLLVKVDDNIARLNMEQARQQWETAVTDLEAVEKFFKSGTASQSELTRARSTANGMRAMYESSSKIYEDSSLRAPISGQVASKEPSVALGNFLSPGFRVTRLVDMDRLRIELTVGERQVGLIEAGADAYITVPSAGDEIEFKGSVDAVAAGSDLSTGSYSLIVTSPNPMPQLIKAGMVSEVRISAKRTEPVIVIPSASIVYRNSQAYVFTVVDGSANPVEIELGKVLGNRAVAVSGLEGGETLIISGKSSIRPGDPVNPTIIGKSGEWK